MKNRFTSSLFYISDIVAGFLLVFLGIAAVAGPIVNPVYQRMNGSEVNGLLIELMISGLLLSLSISLYFVRKRKIYALLYISLVFVVLMFLNKLLISFAISILILFWVPVVSINLGSKNKNGIEGENV